MAWRIAYSLDQLRKELNATRPGRDKSSDGFIGDTSHAASASDHNPNAAGVVCAYDIDNDLDGTNDSNDPEMRVLFEYMRAHPHPDIKYAIYQNRMFSRYSVPGFPAFTMRPYTKPGHFNHIHVSVGVGRDGHSSPPYDDVDLWGVGAALDHIPTPVPPLPAPKEDTMVRLMRPDNDTTVYVVTETPSKWAFGDPYLLADYVNRFSGQILAPTVGGPTVKLDTINGVTVEVCNPLFLSTIPTA